MATFLAYRYDKAEPHILTPQKAGPSKGEAGSVLTFESPPDTPFSAVVRLPWYSRSERVQLWGAAVAACIAQGRAAHSLQGLFTGAKFCGTWCKGPPVP